MGQRCSPFWESVDLGRKDLSEIQNSRLRRLGGRRGTAGARRGGGGQRGTDRQPPGHPRRQRHRPDLRLRHAIRETVWVTAPDIDGDGVDERIATDIIRPRELDGTARVPIIMDASPYYLCSGRGNEAERKVYDADGNWSSSRCTTTTTSCPAATPSSPPTWLAPPVPPAARGGRPLRHRVGQGRRGVARRQGVARRRRDGGRRDWTNGKTGMIGKS